MTPFEIGQKMKIRRESLLLRQEDLAEMSSVATKTIHLVESGTGNPSIETLLKLADILGLELVLQVKNMN